MKEVNFVLYFGANRGKNALNNPQTVTTHANCDAVTREAVTREKENLFKDIYGYLVELSDMGISYADTFYHPSQTCFTVYQTTLVEPTVYVKSLENNQVGIFVKGLERKTDIEFNFLLDMEIHITTLRNLSKAVYFALLHAKKDAANKAREEEEKRQKEEKELFEMFVNNSPYIQMKLKSRDELLSQIIQLEQLLNKRDREFLTNLSEHMEKLSGKETANRFVKFMQNKLNS